MVTASWNGAILAESDTTRIIEGNHYFPPEAVNRRYLRPSDTRTTCGWKGEAHYYTVEVNGQRNEDAAWCYPAPTPEAEAIRNHIAFWHGVKVETS